MKLSPYDDCRRFLASQGLGREARVCQLASDWFEDLCKRGLVFRVNSKTLGFMGAKYHLADADCSKRTGKWAYIHERRTVPADVFSAINTEDRCDTCENIHLKNLKNYDTKIDRPDHT